MNTQSSDNWKFLNEPRKSPNFSLQSVKNGSYVTLEEIDKERIIITYLPGVWAPWCRKLLRELNESLVEYFPFEKNISFIALVSQDFDQLKVFAQSNSFLFDILSDPNGAIGKRYGVFDDNMTEPMKISKPSIFIIDEDKYIRYKFIGKHLTDRPTSKDILLKANEEFPKFEKEKKNNQFFGRIFKNFI